MTDRRGMASAVVSGMAAAGVGWYAATRTWREVVRDRPFPLPDEVVAQTGGAIAPWAVPAALVALAAAVALVATGGVARRVVTVVWAAAGLASAAAGVVGVVEAPGVWPAVVAGAGVAVVVVAGWAWRRHRDWPGMSARYDAPGRRDAGPADPADPAALWDALDRGGDPTRPT
ncbi:tryptophan-associated transmembrane protein [Stackebrandtia albiflava]|uniref:Tryptophan-associated transmembrane protein n=1 Tax=Stackebrandtia albiflava TaxID=406432 RepID=A0A562VEG0_9ACTN|nr:Trp biosynthesis-associated membrane protein [Stackebrandtia albiflava]TWJ16211.1 tryptophan-associated transmembrane protein [Stackebrandtia albiflava]